MHCSINGSAEMLLCALNLAEICHLLLWWLANSVTDGSVAQIVSFDNMGVKT